MPNQQARIYNGWAWFSRKHAIPNNRPSPEATGSPGSGPAGATRAGRGPRAEDFGRAGPTASGKGPTERLSERGRTAKAEKKPAPTSLSGLCSRPNGAAGRDRKRLLRG